MTQLKLKNAIEIGKNPQYSFGVAQFENDRWIGYAKGVGVDMLFVFSQVSERHQLGLTDRDRAIRLTGALAQDPEQAYGGIQQWFVDRSLRGSPKEFRCIHCDIVGCDGSCQEQDWGSEEPPFAELRQSIAPPVFGSKGPCERCSCCQATWTVCAECEGDREIGIENPGDDDVVGVYNEDGLYICPCPSCEGEGGYWVCERDCDAVGKHLVH